MNLHDVPSHSTEAPPEPRRDRGLWALARETLATVLSAVVIAVLVQLFLAQSTVVYGQSMEPNLRGDQRLMVEKVSYHLHGPRRGDIVVVRDPAGGPLPLIKRVIGLPGDRVSITAGRVYIDGVALDEPYLTQVTQGDGRSWTVPPMYVFVMGDNRSNSRDSRFFGPVRLEAVIGHAVFRFWPLDKFGAVR